MCVCCSFEHFVIATGVSYISAGFSTKSISSAGWFRWNAPPHTHHHRPRGPEFDSPSRPPTSVLFGEPRQSISDTLGLDTRMSGFPPTASGIPIPAVGPIEILASRLYESEAPPHDAHILLGFPHCNPCEPYHSKNTIPYQLRNTDASSLTFHETHRTLCQIGLLVGTISGTEALMPH